MEATIGSAIDVGRAVVGAIERRDFDALESLFAPDIRFRALTPRREPAASTARAAREIVADWFADADQIEDVEHSVDEVIDRLHIGYRFRLRTDGAWKLVEQHAVARVSNARIVDLAIVCSGFRPVPEEGIEPVARLDAIGEDCATLTPRIRAAISVLHSGDVLEVRTDDPAAEEGLRAWSRLTGHELVGVTAAPDGPAETFYLRRR